MPSTTVSRTTAIRTRRRLSRLLALALGAVFLWLAERLRRDTTPRRAMLLFHYSLLYLALLFVAMALDLVV